MALEVGGVLNQRYQIDAVLAHGGMGAIYRATDLSLGVQVAVKENLFSTEESSRQFRREATILASLKHPNLPRVTDHFVIPGQGQYLVMDFIEGQDLRDKMEMRDVTEELVVRIGATICDALTYLHTRPNVILHRDIKPGNIKISPNEQVYLVDFGLAKISQPGVATTIGAQALTPGYAPPEQYGAGTDPRSDIYSLGATLYAALTGEIPEDGLARAMGSAELTPIRRRNTNVSPQLAQVVEKAMASAMEDRYQTAEAFKLALLNTNTAARRKMQDAGTVQSLSRSTAETVLAKPLSEKTVLSPSSQPSRPTGGQPPAVLAASKAKFPAWLAVLGGLGLLGVCVVVGAFVFFKLGARQPGASLKTTQTAVALLQATDTPQPPSTPQNTKEPTSEVAFTKEVKMTPTESPTTTKVPEAVMTMTVPSVPVETPTGGSAQIAFVSERSGKPEIWLMNSTGSDLTMLKNIPDGACQPDWSPDGKRLVFVSPCKGKQDLYKGSSLFIMNVDGTGVTPLIQAPGGDFDPAWSPDGKSIAFTSVRKNNVPHIYLYDLETQTSKRLADSSSSDRRPAWSPDGKKIAFETTRGGQVGVSIYLMDADGNNVTPFSNASAGLATMPSWSPNGSLIVFSRGNNYLAAEKQSSAHAIDDDFVISQALQNVYNPKVSPDNFWILYGSIDKNQFDIYLMTVNGGSITKLTDVDGSQNNKDYTPVWKPPQK
jgi:eukaryotic-like serine/threonine-protein kinase